MKDEKADKTERETEPKKPFEKPEFVFEHKMEALAGSCGKTQADALGGDVDCQIQTNS